MEVAGYNQIPIKYYSVRLSPEYDYYNCLYSVLAVARNITKNKIAEYELRNSEERFRAVWESSLDGMRLTDMNGTILGVNNAFCNLVGMEEKELIGKSLYETYNLEGKDLERSLKTYKKRFTGNGFIERRISKSKLSNGRELDLDVSYSLMELNTEYVLLAIFRDISESKKAEEELRKAEKLAAIGKMSAYLSHEIKTPLSSVKMNVDMLYKNLSLPENQKKSFAIIRKEVNRLDKLLKDVLQFSRQRESYFINVSLYSLIIGIKDLIAPSLKEKNIEFINKVSSEFIKGDHQKLKTALLHLFENAVDSITGPGEIEVSTKKIDNNVCLFIRDTGCGIPVPEKIFDPFFTTKTTGTGLGLPITKNIITEHNGIIKLVSSKNGETIFEIIFPLIQV